MSKRPQYYDIVEPYRPRRLSPPEPWYQSRQAAGIGLLVLVAGWIGVLVWAISL